MCGICGVRRFGSEPISEDQITQLLVANMARGNHATGLALQNPGEEIHVLKSPEPAIHFVATKEYKDFLKDHLKTETYTFLGHTRLATQGTNQDNRNNHPLYTNKSAVVHNGCLSNENSIFHNLKLNRCGEVDSDVFRAIFDEKGLTKEAAEICNRLSGSAAIAAISNEYPGKLLLARSGNPIVLAGTREQLIWSSEKNAIHWSLRKWQTRHGLLMQESKPDDCCFQTMQDHSAYFFDEEGLNWHQKFTVASYYRAPIYNVRRTYRNMRERFSAGADVKPQGAFCEKCKVWIVIPDKYRTTPLWELHCTACKTMFATKPEEEEKRA